MSADKPTSNKGISLFVLLKILNDPSVLNKARAAKAAEIAGPEDSTLDPVKCIDPELAKRIAAASDDELREEVNMIRDALTRELEKASHAGKLELIKRLEFTPRQIESLRRIASETLRINGKS